MNARMLRENGLLWQINRIVLHPLGLALSVVVNTDDGTEAFGDIIETDDPEGWEYGDDEGQKKFIKFMNEVGNKKHEVRKAALGYVIQPMIEESKEF